MQSFKFASYFGGIGYALSARDYRIYWYGQVVSSHGVWMHRMAVGVLIFQLTDSPAWLGFIGFVYSLPLMLLGPIAGAIADMRSIPMLLHAPGYVASTTYPPLADEVSGGKPRVESQKTDWIDLIINGQSQITPLLETHQNDRERLLERVRTLLPAAAPPVVVFGWADTAPLVQRWGRGMSSKTFVPLLLVCLSLSGLVTFCLYRLTAIECLHDLRELAALSQVQVIATVSTGVGRRPHDLSRFKHRTAAWIRRIFQMALLLYAMMFATALLTSVATGSLLPDPREALGQVFSIFSSFH